MKECIDLWMGTFIHQTEKFLTWIAPGMIFLAVIHIIINLWRL